MHCCSMAGNAIYAMKRGFAKGMPVEFKTKCLRNAGETYKNMAKWTSMRKQEDNAYDHLSGLEDVWGEVVQAELSISSDSE